MDNEGRVGLGKSNPLVALDIAGASNPTIRVSEGGSSTSYSEFIDVDANKAFVCDKGSDVELSFPKQVVAAVKKGAEFGRCAHLND